MGHLLRPGATTRRARHNVVTCIWLQCCRKFGQVYRRGDLHEYGAVWVWLGWLVPIAALFIPYRVVRDVYRSSRPWPSDIGLVGLWWCCWPAWQFTSYVAVRLRMGGSDAFRPAEIVGAALISGAFVGWLLIVRRVDEGQRQQELAGPGGS